MSTRGDFPTGIYYVPMPHYTAPPPLYERRQSDLRRSYRREGEAFEAVTGARTATELKQNRPLRVWKVVYCNSFVDLDALLCR
jgi:hypothetical protein